MLSVYSTDAASSSLKMVSQIPHLIVSIGFHGFRLLARFGKKMSPPFLSFRFLNASPQFLLHIFLLSPFYKVWSHRFLYICSYTNMGCPVIEGSSFKGTQQNGCLPTHLRTETDSVSETLCSLVFRIPHNGQSKKKG
jgi:hypothetical protein